MTKVTDYFHAHEENGEAIIVGKPGMAFLWLSKQGEEILLCDFEGAGETDVSDAVVEDLLIQWLNDVAAEPSTVHDIPHLNVTFKDGRFRCMGQ